MNSIEGRVPWHVVMFVIGFAALVFAWIQINQTQNSQVSNESISGTLIALQETEISYQKAINEENEPLATSAEQGNLEDSLATVEAQRRQVELTATQGVLLTQTAIAGTPIYYVDNDDYDRFSISESVAENQLLCITTGPIKVSTSKSSLQFTGIGRGSIICWIGAQFAQASGLNGYASIKHVEISQGAPFEIANELSSQWELEMTTRSDGCGINYGPCDAADLAIVLSDGSIIRP